MQPCDFSAMHSTRGTEARVWLRGLAQALGRAQE